VGKSLNADISSTVRHTEGNWSLHTADFSKSPLYAYYNPLDPASIIQTHCELEDIIANEGPFDGVFGYSGGAALASELILGQDAFTLDPIFRFAIFVNGASPLRVFKLEDVEIAEGETFDSSAALEQARSMFLRPSALRNKDGVSEEDQNDHAKLLGLLDKLQGMKSSDGTAFLSDGVHGICRRERRAEDAPLINIPTVHICGMVEDGTDPHHGLHLLKLCNEDAREIVHEFGHDFPRGRQLMKQVAPAIRACAEDLLRL
jgi:hypothetical protein